MPIKQATAVSLILMIISVLLTLIPRFIEKLKVWHEVLMFTIYYVLWQFAFAFWIYRLEEMRLLALINALIIITMLLLYTNVLQSIILSFSTLLTYSIIFAKQSGSLAEEMFFSFCLIPSFIFTSTGAHFLNKRRNALRDAKQQIEKTNFELEREKKLTEIELDLAKDIQRSIFHNKAPHLKNWDLAFFSRPYRSVSGDFFDFFTEKDTLNGLCLFDVSGHGVAPALITILAKPIVTKFFNMYKNSPLGIIAKKISDALKPQLDEVNLFVTGIILRFDSDYIEYLNAGHPDLIKFNPEKKKLKLINAPDNQTKGVPIGIDTEKDNYKSIKFKAKIGDYFIIYSDGIIEEKNKFGDIYSTDRLFSIIEQFQGNSSQELLDSIISDFNNFCESKKSNDDITLIIGKKTQ